MTRSYNPGRRAEQQAKTRRRIVEAAVDLHSSVGPARTTISMVAERAGVQRHTVYAHFPDERSLFFACSSLALERDPLPDAEAWTAIKDGREKLLVGLRAIYDWYERNADLAAHVLRDGEHHVITRELVALRYVPVMAAYHKALGKALNRKQGAVLHLALSFFTWRTLVRESGMTQTAAVGTMADAVDCAGRTRSAAGAQKRP
jgi:AcrR family transcriptional regulator